MTRLNQATLVVAVAVLLALGAGCGDDQLPPIPGDHGSISIDANPNGLNAPWTLAGPNSYSHANNGDKLLEDLEPDSYTIHWGEVPGWTIPADETQSLPSDGSVTFSGTYVRQDPPVFVTIPAGSFTMGAPSDELGSDSNERPQHTVTLTHSFYLQATEVTNQQYLELAQWAYDQGHATATSSSLRDALDGSTEELLDMDGERVEIAFSNGTFSLRDAGHGLNPDHPAKEVTWYGAAAYCDWLSMQEELPRAYNHVNWQCNSDSPYTAVGYRLPTEAEWEYACRAGSITAFSNGAISVPFGCAPIDPVLDQIGWFSCNAEGWTHPVGQKIPNAWGLFDMHGNQYEWCNDWFGDYSSSAAIDPVGPLSGSDRVLRGGIRHSEAFRCRSARREANLPAYGDTDNSLRPARSAD